MKKITLSIFLEFVEIRTKIASFFPLMTGLLWSYYHYKQFNWLNSVIFVLAVFIFDMTTTAINNTMDFYKARNSTYKYEENIIGKYQLDYKTMFNLTLLMFIASILIASSLIWLTDVSIVLMGVVCFTIGLFYTFGPMPLSRLPLGELFSGVTMGFGIFFLAVFVNVHEQLIVTHLSETIVQFDIYWQEILTVFVHAIPYICLIANIMLANNTCDLETDISNHRYTLVYYIGQSHAVNLYTLLAIIPLVFWGIWILIGEYPSIMLIAVLPIIYTFYYEIRLFRHEQIKSTTFATALRMLISYGIMWLSVLVISIVWRLL